MFVLLNALPIKERSGNFNVDFPALNISVLGIDWYSLFDSEFDIDNVYNTWVAQFHTIIEKYISRKTVTIRPRDKPWMNGIVRRAIRRRNVCFVFIIKNEPNFLGKIIVVNEI
jgi:hypothetical protein